MTQQQLEQQLTNDNGLPQLDPKLNFIEIDIQLLIQNKAYLPVARHKVHKETYDKLYFINQVKKQDSVITDFDFDGNHLLTLADASEKYVGEKDKVEQQLLRTYGRHLKKKKVLDPNQLKKIEEHMNKPRIVNYFFSLF